MNASRQWRKIPLAVAVASIALIGVAVALYSTSPGIGTDADSATYLMAAHSLVSGQGLTVPTPDGRRIPMTGFPPLLPIVLGAFEFIGVDPLAGARVLNALFFGANTILVGFLIHRYTRSGSAAIFGALLTVTTADALYHHSVLISEPLFLVLALVGLTLVGLYIESSSFPLLLAFSAAFALAGATRYAGLSLIPVGAVAIVFCAGRPRRWRHLGLFLTIFGVPLSVWLLRNLALVHTLFDRTFAFHPPGLNRFLFSYFSLSTWVLPGIVPQRIRVFIVSAVILLVCQRLFLKIRTRDSRRWSFPEVGALFLASYVLLFLVVQTFFDAQIWISGRHLLAVYFLGLAMAICHGSDLLDQSTRYVRAGCLLLCILAAGVGVVRTARTAVRLHREGIGLSSKYWQNSILVAKVKELDSRTPLFSNAGSAVYLLTGRLARALPDQVNAQTQRIRPEYGAEMDRMKRRLQREGGVVVIFTKFAAARELAAEDEMEKQLELQRVAVTDDGYFLLRPGS